MRGSASVLLEIQDQSPLKWPEGWSRTLISDRRTQAAWKRPYRWYLDEVTKELARMGVASATVSHHHDGEKARQDPGVALWFSLKAKQDWSWQSGLQIDNPIPSLEEIDSAYKRLAQKHHPDAVANGSGGDIQMFHMLTGYRKAARAWVLGGVAQAHDNCIPCDKFTEPRLNLAAIRSALVHFRGLERVGIPAILERVMSTAFKSALPQNASKDANGSTAA